MSLPLRTFCLHRAQLSIVPPATPINGSAIGRILCQDPNGDDLEDSDDVHVGADADGNDDCDCEHHAENTDGKQIMASTCAVLVCCC